MTGKYILSLALSLISLTGFAAANVLVRTPAYVWKGDSIVQDQFFATAPSTTEIISTYAASPGYKMPVEQKWTLKNDISSFSQMSTANTLLAAVYNMALDEMVNAVEPDTTLRTGKEWAGVWTRDVSYSIILSMAAMQPEASKISLKRKVNSEGVIIQDTGSGGAWPVSTDHLIWAVAAYELYKVTGDRDWLQYLYDVVKRTLEKNEAVTTSPSGLVYGETSFIDWREQSYPKWMQPADIYNSQAFNTAVVHAAAMDVLSQAATALGHNSEAQKWADKAKALKKKINETFWLDQKGHYGMYTYGRDYQLLNQRSETLGQALAILFDVASAEQAADITLNSPVTKWGAPIFFPGIADMPSYHNNALWPFVASYWTLANAKAGNEMGIMQGFGSIVRPAALFATNKENLNLDNGDIATELNSSNMLWSLAGNIALTQRLLFGINYEENGIRFSPVVPRQLSDTRTLSGLKYRNAILNITVSGFGNEIKEFTINGKRTPSCFLKADAKGVQNIRIVMADNDMPYTEVNMVDNTASPLTPIAKWAYTPEAPYSILEWLPIEYITKYKVMRDGKLLDIVENTTYPASIPGEYTVVAINEAGEEGFASEPLSNRPQTRLQPENLFTTIVSPEALYVPDEPITGMHGGFAETDSKSGPINISFTTPEEGYYSIALRYANGNGPVNTDNNCAIRTLAVDGIPAGTTVMPQRGVGAWSNWGLSNTVHVKLSAGPHVITIEMLPQDTNMDLNTNHALIDEIIITKL